MNSRNWGSLGATLEAGYHNTNFYRRRKISEVKNMADVANISQSLKGF